MGDTREPKEIILVLGALATFGSSAGLPCATRSADGRAPSSRTWCALVVTGIAS